MRTSSSNKRRSSSRTPDITTSQHAGSAGLATVFLLALILVTGPLILGAARLWLQLPLLGAVAGLLLLQGFRLTSRPLPGVFRQADAIDLTVVLFVLYTVIRWLTSPTEYFSRIEMLDVVGYAAVFFTCRYGLAQRKLALALIFGLVALGLFETGFGYYLTNHPEFFPFGEKETLQLYYAPRWVGTYGCPNHYGSLLVMAVGATMALACFSKLSWPVRIVLFYLAGVMTVGVLYSLSRGSWLGLIASVGAIALFGLRYGTVRWWVPVSGAVIVLVAAGALFSLSSNARQRFWDAEEGIRTGTIDSYCRLELARDTLRIAKDYPAFGTGPATFVFIHPRYQGGTFSNKAIFSHNDYLNCLDDYGLVGFGLAMIFVALVTLKFFQHLRVESRWQDRVILAAGFAAWAALLVHSVVDFNLHIPANALMLFALVGLGLGRLNRNETGHHWSTISLLPLGPWFGWAVVIVSLLYGYQVGRTALGDIAYEQAYAQALIIPTSESIRQAEDALRYDPGNANDLRFLGDLHRYRASRQDDMEGRMAEGQKALAAYKKALAANPLDDSIHARMGMTFDVMLRYSEAFFSYQAAVQAQPYNGQFWAWLGNHYWQRGMTDKAEEAYLRSEKCPHGREGSADAVKELHAQSSMQQEQGADQSSADLIDQTPKPEEPEPATDAPPAEAPLSDEAIKAAQNHPPTTP